MYSVLVLYPALLVLIISSPVFKDRHPIQSVHRLKQKKTGCPKPSLLLAPATGIDAAVKGTVAAHTAQEASRREMHDKGTTARSFVTTMLPLASFRWVQIRK